MAFLLSFLFPNKTYNVSASWILLFVRILFGLLLLRHGVQKWTSYDAWAPYFPDPFGFGARFSLMFTASAECVCSIAFVLGFFHRLCMLPLLAIMSVAFFVIFGGEPFPMRELPFIYLCVFLITYVAGPGKYSLDYHIYHWIKR